MKKLIVLSLVLLFLTLSAGAVYFYIYCHRPVQESGEFLINIPPGTALKNVAVILNEEGLIEKTSLFIILARIKKAEYAIKSGEYSFKMPLSPVELLNKLKQGEVLCHATTVPEGSTLAEIAVIMEKAEITRAEEILNKASDSSFIKKLGFEGNNLEGFMFPDTYRFRKETPAEKILKVMTSRYRAVMAEELEQFSMPDGFSERQVVILASMVEKEAGNIEEMPVIAGVFLNRLKKGMRLECDPTVIYGVVLESPDFEGRLRNRHLRTPHPYNTYHIFGLPPGPICNPGRNAIRAVLNPEEVDYLFFVSKNDGTHHFSRSLREHNRAVDRYQRGK